MRSYVLLACYECAFRVHDHNFVTLKFKEGSLFWWTEGAFDLVNRQTNCYSPILGLKHHEYLPAVDHGLHLEDG